MTLNIGSYSGRAYESLGFDDTFDNDDELRVDILAMEAGEPVYLSRSDIVKLVSHLRWVLNQPATKAPEAPAEPAYEGCRAERDGDCYWARCPQDVHRQSSCPLIDDADDGWF